ncbi:MAG TPA: hypothetical protein VGD71_13990 [Kribbella sp.]
MVVSIAGGLVLVASPEPVVVAADLTDEERAVMDEAPGECSRVSGPP